MYITKVPNRNSPPAILLRESYREDGKVKNRTLANLSKLPPEVIETIRAALKGGNVTDSLADAFEVERSLPHGHVAAVLGTLQRLGLHSLVARRRSRKRDLCVGAIASFVLDNAKRSKLSVARKLRNETAQSSLGQVLGVDDADSDELYEAMDWLLQRQTRIENALASRHLSDGTLVLYDLTSTYFEGRSCPLSQLGYSRDGKRGKLQIVFGLLTDSEGCPVAVEVFDGNTADPKTVTSQVDKLRDRFGLQRVVMVGDRGMLTAARIREDLQDKNGLDWITALRAPAVRKLVDNGSLQLSLFDEKDLAEISDPEYPDERLVVCRNPLLAEERARKRAELLDATEAGLQQVQIATERPKRPLRGTANIAARVTKVLDKYKVGKHFEVDITDETVTFARKQDQIEAEAALDGIYVVRTSVAAEKASAEDVVKSYKSLAVVERAFRRIKTVDLNVRPINHRLADRVRAHVFLCMLAYYVEWHMRRDLAPLLFHEDDPAAGEAQRRSVVSPAARSEAARAKDATKRTADGYPVQSFADLLQNLATVVKDEMKPTTPNVPRFHKTTRPTPLQQRAFDLLQVSPHKL